MARLEVLPVELLSMVLRHCSPESLRALISASPASLDVYCGYRHRILEPTRQAVEEALGGLITAHTLYDCGYEILQVLRLRLYRKRAISRGLDELDVWQFAKQHITQISSADDAEGVNHTIPESCWNHLGFLLECLEFVDQLERLSEGLVSFLSGAQSQGQGPLWYDHDGPLWHPFQDHVQIPPEECKNYLVLFETYCQSFFYGNHVHHREAANQRRRFYLSPTELLGADAPVTIQHRHFGETLKYVFRSHKRIV